MRERGYVSRRSFPFGSNANSFQLNIQLTKRCRCLAGWIQIVQLTAMRQCNIRLQVKGFYKWKTPVYTIILLFRKDDKYVMPVNVKR